MLHALNNKTVQLPLDERAGQFIGRLGIKHGKLNALAFVGSLNLQQLILEPVEARVLACADKPDADLFRGGEA